MEFESADLKFAERKLDRLLGTTNRATQIHILCGWLMGEFHRGLNCQKIVKDLEKSETSDGVR